VGLRNGVPQQCNHFPIRITVSSSQLLLAMKTAATTMNRQGRPIKLNKYVIFLLGSFSYARRFSHFLFHFYHYVAWSPEVRRANGEVEFESCTDEEFDPYSHLGPSRSLLKSLDARSCRCDAPSAFPWPGTSGPLHSIRSSTGLCPSLALRGHLPTKRSLDGVMHT
jgi:hypothetical protein